jgi:hypothetical protein
MGNYHARFLGGKGAERPLLYPVSFEDELGTQHIDQKIRQELITTPAFLLASINPINR